MPCLEQVEAHDHTGCIFLDLEGNRGLARGCNEYSTQVRVDHPGRFGFYANLPNLKTDLEGSLAEVEYALDSLKADGVCLMTHYDGYYLGHPESVKTFPSIVIRTDGCVPLGSFIPLWKELDRRKTTVLIHPTPPEGYKPIPAQKYCPCPAFDFCSETTRTASHLPDSVDFVVAHEGDLSG